MIVSEITAGTVEPIQVYARSTDGPLTGSSNLRVSIRRESDGLFYDFNDATFKAYASATTPLATLTEVDAAHAAGYYKVSGGVDTTGWASGSYFVTGSEVSTELVVNGPDFANGEIRIVAATPSSLSSRIPSSLSSGRMRSQVEGLDADTVTADAIATNAIDSDSIAASAVTELQSGLATSSALTSVGTDAALAASRAADLQSRTPAALVSGRTPAHVEAMGTNVLTEDAVAASAVVEIQSGLATSAALSAAATDAGLAASRSLDLQGRVPAALVSGRMDASVGAMQTDVITNSAVAASAVTEIQSGLATSASLTAVGSAVGAVAAAVADVQADTDDIQARLPAALVGGRMPCHVEAVATDALSAAAVSAGAVTKIQSGLATSGAVAALPTAGAIADAVCDELLTGHTAAGSVGEALGSVSGSTPEALAEAVWSKLLSSYGAGTAGRFLHRLYLLGFGRLELSANGGGENVLYGADNATPLVAFDITDHTGSPISLSAGVPARRGAGVDQ
jgi:hypothetical protein